MALAAADTDPSPSAQDSPPPRRRRRWAWAVLGLVLILLLLLAALAHWEMQHSTLQARYLSAWARQLGFTLEPGPNRDNLYPRAGPYDERLGYTRLPGFVDRLTERHHAVTDQARQTPALQDYLRQGFFSPHAEKSQAGLQVSDCRGAPLYAAAHPQHAYASADDIPTVLARSLSFIENRELLDATAPTHNPAVEWERLGKAMVDQAQALLVPDHPAAGGSTLATQLEKFRHSPDGRTAGVHDKVLQMVSASVRAYRDGEDTTAARRRILLDYVNGLPLGALRGHGEVNGVLDGLSAWFGTAPEEANRLLRAPAAELDPAGLAQRALVFRQTLALLIAQRRPAHFFGAGQAQLAQLTDAYVRLLRQAGVIDEALADGALAARLTVRTGHEAADVAGDFSDRKAAKLVRSELSQLLDTPNFYDLERLDLQARSSIDLKLQSQVSELLRRLREPGEAQAAGLVGKQLLEHGDPARLYYSFTLVERAPGANRVRVQTDNLDQPFDINTGAKLELGSTAKLRTLVTYLEIIANLHAQLAPLGRRALDEVDVARKDRLTRWAVDHLKSTSDRRLQTMLDAAMDRRYSASPGETFYTGGGEHHFENFRREDDGKSPTLREALRDSVNLVFIRLMRDVVYHHMYRQPGSAARILEDPQHPDRSVLLARFADREGAQFTRNFYRKLQGKSPAQLLDALTAGLQPTPQRLAVIFRSLQPEAPLADFSRFLASELPSSTLDQDDLRALYDKHAPGAFSLPDRGYLARLHPLELWVASHLRDHPKAALADVLEAGKPVRQEVYGWLFRTRAKAAQNRRILSLLEIDAFADIHRAWQRLGYPFDKLVPSYATAIGSSGDRPAALAELMGIIVNDGVRQPTVQTEALAFATGTPFEVRLQRQANGAEQVMPAEVATTVRAALALVVEQGTARRLNGAMDDAGPIRLGGKTGTGDNRLNAYSARGAQTGSKVLNRTATFVFFLGDRHYGTITAFVPGAAAEDFRFTSALPVQIVKLMAPLLKPVLHGQAGAACPEPAQLSEARSAPPAPFAGEAGGLAALPRKVLGASAPASSGRD